MNGTPKNLRTGYHFKGNLQKIVVKWLQAPKKSEPESLDDDQDPKVNGPKNYCAILIITVQLALRLFRSWANLREGD